LWYYWHQHNTFIATIRITLAMPFRFIYKTKIQDYYYSFMNCLNNLNKYSLTRFGIFILIICRVKVYIVIGEKYVTGNRKRFRPYHRGRQSTYWLKIWCDNVLYSFYARINILTCICFVKTYRLIYKKDFTTVTLKSVIKSHL